MIMKTPKKHYRGITTKVKTAKGRKRSSTKWLQRQLNDPYVVLANKMKYRSRAAFKLIELNEKFKFLKKSAKVVDLGAAPGGWSQIAAEICAGIVAVDLKEMEHLPGVTAIVGDFLDHETQHKISDAIGGKADVVLSDMAANASGHKSTDHIRIITLVEAAYDFACDHLNEGGAFVAKVLKGGAESALLKNMKQNFRTVKHAKPPSSRPDSSESYVVAMGFKKSLRK